MRGWLGGMVAVAALMAALPAYSVTGPSRNPVVLSADEITYDENLGIVVAKGHVEVSPVLASHGDRQSVTFDGQEPAKFTLARCKEIGCCETVTKTVGDGRVNLLPAQSAHTPTRQLPAHPKRLRRPAGS